MLAPLTDLVSECGETNATTRTGKKDSPWCWDEIYQNHLTM